MYNNIFEQVWLNYWQAGSDISKNAEHVSITAQIYGNVKEADISNEVFKRTLKDRAVEELKAVDGNTPPPAGGGD